MVKPAFEGWPGAAASHLHWAGAALGVEAAWRLQVVVFVRCPSEPTGLGRADVRGVAGRTRSSSGGSCKHHEEVGWREQRVLRRGVLCAADETVRCLARAV
jgi:hypothetical protein